MTESMNSSKSIHSSSAFAWMQSAISYEIDVTRIRLQVRSRSNGLRFIILLWIQDSPATSNSLSSFNQFAVGSRHAGSHLQSHASPGFEVEDLNSGWSRGFA